MYIYRERDVPRSAGWRTPWLGTNGVNAHGAAAEVMNFDSFGKKIRPGTFGKIKLG